MDKRVKIAFDCELVASKYRLKKLISDAPELEEAKYYYAKTVIKLNNSTNQEINEAIELLKTLKEYDEDFINFRIAKGYKRLKNFNIARIWLEKPKKSADKLLKYRAILEEGSIYFEEGDITKANSIYKSLLTDDNNINKDEVKLQIAKIHIKRGQRALAFKVLRSLSKTSYELEAKFEAAKLEYSSGNNKTALKEFKKLSYTRLSEDVSRYLKKLKKINYNIEKKNNNINISGENFINNENIKVVEKIIVPTGIKDILTPIINDNVSEEIMLQNNSDNVGVVSEADNKIEKVIIKEVKPEVQSIDNTLTKNKRGKIIESKDLTIQNEALIKKDKVNKNQNIEKENFVKDYIDSITKKELFELQLYLYPKLDLDVNNNAIKLYDLLMGTLYTPIDEGVDKYEFAQEKVKKYILLNEKINRK